MTSQRPSNNWRKFSRKEKEICIEMFCGIGTYQMRYCFIYSNNEKDVWFSEISESDFTFLFCYISIAPWKEPHLHFFWWYLMCLIESLVCRYMTMIWAQLEPLESELKAFKSNSVFNKPASSKESNKYFRLFH